jgi:hypothetical protein
LVSRQEAVAKRVEVCIVVSKHKVPHHSVAKENDQEHDNEEGDVQFRGFEDVGQQAQLL